MIIGITGSSGVLGKAIIKEFFKLKKIHIIKFRKDVLDRKSVKNWIISNNFDVIIHLAAIVSTKQFNNSSKYSEKVNYEGTKNIVDNIKYSKKKILLFFSSTSHVYKKSFHKINEKSIVRPINNYGLSKFKAENYIKKNKKNYDFCIARIFSYTALSQSKDFFIPSIVNRIKKTKNIFLVDFRNEYRDFIHIGDIVSMIKTLIIKKKNGTYNICSGYRTSIYDIVKKITFKLKKKYTFDIKDEKLKGLLGCNKKIKTIYKRKFRNIDFIINEYLNI